MVPFRDELTQYMIERYPEIREQLRGGRITDELAEKINRIITKFKALFLSGDTMSGDTSNV